MAERRGGKNPTTSEPPDPGVGHPRELFPVADIRYVMVEVAKLQVQQSTLEREVGDQRGDMRDARDRLKGLEVKVDHLPSKGFIVAVVTAALLLLGALIAVAPKIQEFLGFMPPAP